MHMIIVAYLPTWFYIYTYKHAHIRFAIRYTYYLIMHWHNQIQQIITPTNRSQMCNHVLGFLPLPNKYHIGFVDGPPTQFLIQSIVRVTYSNLM